MTLLGCDIFDTFLIVFHSLSPFVSVMKFTKKRRRRKNDKYRQTACSSTLSETASHYYYQLSAESNLSHHIFESLFVCGRRKLNTRNWDEWKSKSSISTLSLFLVFPSLRLIICYAIATHKTDRPRWSIFIERMQTIINHHYIFGICTKIAFCVCLWNRRAHTMFREVIKERKIKRFLRINSKSKQTKILFSSDFALWILCPYQSIQFQCMHLLPIAFSRFKQQNNSRLHQCDAIGSVRRAIIVLVHLKSETKQIYDSA